MRKQPIICLVGIDGSGKSTQIDKLDDWLSGRGHRVGRAWCRWKPLFPRPFMFLAKISLFRKTAVKDAHISKEEGHRYSRWQETKRRLFRWRVLRAMWWSVAVCDYVLQTRWKIRRASRSKSVLIIDRYTYDLAVDQALNFGYDEGKLISLSRGWWTRLLPRPTLTLFLDIPTDEAFKRKDDIPSVEYLEQLRAAYTALSRAQGFVIIDASGTVEQVHDAVVHAVEEVLLDRG